MVKKRKDEIAVTTHAYSRMSERLGWKNKSTAFEQAKKAYTIGMPHSEFPNGDCRSWCDGFYLRHRNANNMKYFAEALFIFRNYSLITVIRIPEELRKEFRSKFKKYQEETKRQQEAALQQNRSEK